MLWVSGSHAVTPFQTKSLFTVYPDCLKNCSVKPINVEATTTNSLLMEALITHRAIRLSGIPTKLSNLYPKFHYGILKLTDGIQRQHL